jgi:hypothetical protein
VMHGLPLITWESVETWGYARADAVFIALGF